MMEYSAAEKDRFALEPILKWPVVFFFAVP